MAQTSPRRLYPRQLRRLQVRFWRPGEERARQGFTKNVSVSGAFVSTPDPAPRGERLRLELSDGGRVALIHGVVVHAHRVPPDLRRFADSAMGLRFLGLDELVGPFLDEEALRPLAEGDRRGSRMIAGGAAAPGATTGAAPAVPAPARGGGSSPPDAPAAVPGTGARRGPEGGPGAAVSGPRAVPPVAGSSYVLRFASPSDFLATYRRDLVNGGLFITTDRPAPVHERVMVDLHLPGPTAPVVRLEGRVVQVIEARPVASGQMVGGVGLEILDPDAMLRELAPFVGTYEAG